MNTQTNFSSWWGRHSVELGKNEFWQIGPFHLWVQHLPHQWRLQWTQTAAWLETVIRANSGAFEPVPSHVQQTTCMFGDGRDELLFAPLLPDRPVIAQLATPIRVLPGEEVSVYCLSPLWLKIESVQPQKALTEAPLFRMSDTWFGPMSQAGELCYASPSPAFLQLRDVPLRLHCVITAIQIKNSGTLALPVERINLPMPRLSLFYSTRTGFWTDTITLETNGDDVEMATIRVHQQPPPDAAPTQFVAAPRAPAVGPGTPVVRAFSALFRDRG